MLGNEIKKDSIITYPVRYGSSLWMSYAFVRDVEEYDYVHKKKDRFVIEVFSFKFHWGDEEKTELKRMVKSRLYNIENAIVIDNTPKAEKLQMLYDQFVTK